MSDPDKASTLFLKLQEKGSLKQEVYQNTHLAFSLLKKQVQELIVQYKSELGARDEAVPLEFSERGEFELELKFAGDVLLFVMHTNVFEIPRDHALMRSNYIKEDKMRSYCGIINVYNFLADSLKYKRMNDTGYLIGRVFINKDMHYFTEGKREIGMLYQHFPSAVLDDTAVLELLVSAMNYTIDFDLLTPPFDNVKEVSLYEMRTTLDSMQLRTAKRMGFKFLSDTDNLND